jgi:hypothetical protein
MTSYPTPDFSPTTLSELDSKGAERSERLRKALEYGACGWPVFPCVPCGKEPLTRHGHLDATTDRSRITAWWNRWPDANIGIPTGGRSGILALDVDQPVGLYAFEAEHGELTATRKHLTGSGGMHYLYRYPEGCGIRNSAGKLAPGVDVRGEGGYVIVPPSATTRVYEVLDALPPAEPPAALMDALTALQEPRKEDGKVKPITMAASVSTDGSTIPQGSRDDGITRIAGRLHDGTRDLDALAADLLQINARRCEPPLPDSQVLKIARSIYGREPCKAGRPPEVEELVGALSDYWHGQTWEKLAGKSDARFARALIREGRKFGRRVTSGLRVEKSFRQMAEILGVHRNTVGNIVNRGKAAGWLRQDNAGRRREEPGAFVLVDPRRFCDTDNQGAAVGEGVTSLSRLAGKPLNVADLSTPHYRYRGPVGYSKEHTLCVFEACGPLNRETAAGLLGWSRSRDLERLHLEPLGELGLLEKRGDLYALPGDYRERQEGIREETYSTVQPRVRRERSAEGRFVHVVRDSGMVASESERARLDRERHKRERQAYRESAKPDYHYVSVGADGYVEDLEVVGEHSTSAELSSLAVAIRDYLDRHPHQARQPAGWIGVTLWADGLHPKLDEPPAQTRAAIEELGGVAYLDAKLKEAKGAA